MIKPNLKPTCVTKVEHIDNRYSWLAWTVFSAMLLLDCHELFISLNLFTKWLIFHLCTIHNQMKEWEPKQKCTYNIVGNLQCICCSLFKLLSITKSSTQTWRIYFIRFCHHVVREHSARQFPVVAIVWILTRFRDR